MQSKHLQMIAHGLILIAVMLGVIAAALWFRPDGVVSTTQAQTAARYVAAPGEAVNGVPDAGKQRLMLIEQFDSLNKRLAEVERGLRDGTYVIQTIEAKNAGKSGAKAAEKEAE